MATTTGEDTARSDFMKAAISKNLRAFRRSIGMTVEALAKLADIHPVTLRAIEHGRRVPSLGTLDTLAASLNTTPDILLRDPKINAKELKLDYSSKKDQLVLRNVGQQELDVWLRTNNYSRRHAAKEVFGGAFSTGALRNWHLGSYVPDDTHRVLLQEICGIPETAWDQNIR